MKGVRVSGDSENGEGMEDGGPQSSTHDGQW